MIEFYSLAGLIGTLISIEDLKFGLIKNRYVALLILIGLVSKFFYPVDIIQFAIVLFYGLVVSVFFWLLEVWPAGDAKFFWALLFFLPANLYANSGIIWGFLTNTFVPVFVVMFFVIVYKSKLRVILASLRAAFNPYTILMLFVMITGFLWFFQQVMNVLSVKVDFLVMLIALFAVFEFFRRYCSFRNELLFIGLAVARVLINYQSVYSVNFFFNSAKFIIVFAFFRFFILKLAFLLYTEEVPIKKLKEGMSLAEGVSKKGKGFKKERLLSTSFIGLIMQKKKKFIHNIESLSTKDVQNLKKLDKDGRLPFASLLVHQVQPFAIFILTGFIITVVCKGNCFSVPGS